MRGIVSEFSRAIEGGLAGIVGTRRYEPQRRVRSSTIVFRLAPGAQFRRKTAASPSSRSVFWSAFLIFASLATVWSLASPIFSVPDENAHALKAVAQVRGQVLGYQVEGVKHTVVDLPA